MIYFPQNREANPTLQLGTAIGQGLAALAEGKANQLIRRQQQKQTEEGLIGFGYSPEKAKQLSHLDPQVLREVIKNERNKPSESYINALNAQYGGGQQGHQNALAALGQLEQNKTVPEQKLDMDQLLQQLRTNPSALALGGLGKQFGSQFEPIQQQASPQLAQQREAVQGQKAPIDFTGMTHKEIENTIKAQQQSAEELKREKIEAHKALQQKRAEAQAAHKETKAYYDELIKKEKAAEQDDIRLGGLEKLVKNGKLPNSALWSTLSKLEETSIGTLATAGAGLGGLIGAAGGPLAAPAAATGAIIGGATGALVSPVAGAIKTLIRSTSPDIEEFEKLSTDFVKNAKQYFGSRLTDADLRAFMSTIPTLMQTDAGKLKVINNLKEFNSLAKTEARLARQIIRANGGLRPPNLDSLVHDALSSEIDKLAQKFSQ